PFQNCFRINHLSKMGQGRSDVNFGHKHAEETLMARTWMRKLVAQFGIEWDTNEGGEAASPTLSESKAALLHVIDVYSKYLIDVEGQPIKKVRETMEELAKAIVSLDQSKSDKAMFRFRQF